MKRAPWVSVLVISLAAVALSGCTVAGESFSVERPEWKAGYTWAYDWGTTSEWVEIEDGERENETWGNSGHSALRVLNTTYDVDGIPFYLAYEDHEYGGDLVAFRQSDLARAWVGWGYESSCGQTGCTYTGEISIYDDDLPINLDFPLEKGKTWTHIDEEGDDDFNVKMVTETEVKGQRLLETEMGQIGAIRVDSVTTIANLDETLKFFRQMLEAEGMTVHKLEGTYREKSTVYYAQDYQIAVNETYEEISTFHIKASYEGETFEEEENYHGTYWAQITGASLVAGPEVAIDDVLTLMAEGYDVQDPTGEIVVAPTYWVDIESVVDEITMPQDDTLSFRAVIDGEEGMPAEDLLEWRVTDWRGNNVATVAGDALDYQPELPGYYGIELVALGNGTVRSQAFTDSFAHYMETLSPACGNAEISGFGIPDDCASLDIPVFPGASYLRIVATPQTLTPGQTGEIRLVDAFGTSIRAGDHGDRDDLEMEDLDWYGMGEAGWELDYVWDRAVMAEVSMDVYIDYDVPGAVFFADYDIDWENRSVPSFLDMVQQQGPRGSLL